MLQVTDTGLRLRPREGSAAQKSIRSNEKGEIWGCGKSRDNQEQTVGQLELTEGKTVARTASALLHLSSRWGLLTRLTLNAKMRFTLRAAVQSVTYGH